MSGYISGHTAHKCGPFPVEHRRIKRSSMFPNGGRMPVPPPAHTLWRCATCGQWWYRHPSAPLGGRTSRTVHLPQLWCRVQWWHRRYRRTIKRNEAQL